LLVLALLLAACDAAEHDPDHGRREARHDAPIDHHGNAAEVHDDLLRIDPEMLRDLRITTSAVESRPGGDGVTALGEVAVDEERYAEIGSPVAARVTDLVAAVGDNVVAGQPLAGLESVELGKARAELVTARAHAELARQSLARKRSLAAERIVPRREVQEAEAAGAAAVGELRAAEAALSALGASATDDDVAHGARFRLRSPVAGVVIDRDVKRGAMVEPTRALFRVADLRRLWLTVHVFERDAVRVRPGAAARVTFAALPGRSFAGTVTLVGRRADTGSRTLPVRVEVANDDDVLRPGMSASAWMPFGDSGSTVVTVPTASLQRVQSSWVVFIPRGEAGFEPRRVGRGRDLDGEVEIVEGIAPGETVVSDGAFLLKAEAEKARGEGEHHDH
jgi:cobalt-zinc-cadmium efflux system membrane fusion protein